MGCGVGFLAGLFGVGGGIIMVPILIFSYEHFGVPSIGIDTYSHRYQPICHHLCVDHECLPASKAGER